MADFEGRLGELAGKEMHIPCNVPSHIQILSLLSSLLLVSCPASFTEDLTLLINALFDCTLFYRSDYNWWSST